MSQPEFHTDETEIEADVTETETAVTEPETEAVETEAVETEAVETEAVETETDVTETETVETETETEAPPQPNPAHQAHLQTVLQDLRGQRQVEQSIEALLVSTRVPMTTAELAEALQLEASEVQEALGRLEVSLGGRALGLFPRQKGDVPGWVIDVRAAYRPDVAAVAPPLLKPAITESLALIAINQPIPQARLVRERGSTVYDHVKELMARGLVQRTKKGRSYVLWTTDAFAAEFGLANDPELIRRALAKTAGFTGDPQTIGSQRIHFDEAAKASAESLQAEAQEIASEQAELQATETAQRAARIQAALAEVEAEQPPAPPAAEPIAPIRRTGLAAGRGPVSRLPSDAFDSLPSRDEAVVSGGEAPVDQRFSFSAPAAAPAPSFHPQETVMDAPTRDDNDPIVEVEKTSESSRLARLLAMTADTDTTDDDW